MSTAPQVLAPTAASPHDGVPHDPAPHDFAWAVLSDGEALVLWAVRHWHLCMADGANPTPLLYDGFEFSGALPALRPLARFMSAVQVGRRRDLEIEAPATAMVTDDERVLLRVLAFAQHGLAELCETRLMSWLPRAAARAAMPHARRLAWTLGVAGLALPIRDRQAAGRQSSASDCNWT